MPQRNLSAPNETFFCQEKIEAMFQALFGAISLAKEKEPWDTHNTGNQETLRQIQTLWETSGVLAPSDQSLLQNLIVSYELEILEYGLNHAQSSEEDQFYRTKLHKKEEDIFYKNLGG